MEADEIVKCAIDSICVCGGQVILEEDTIHQKVELPEIKPIVTEYRLQKGYCKGCKHRTDEICQIRKKHTNLSF